MVEKYPLGHASADVFSFESTGDVREYHVIIHAEAGGRSFQQQLDAVLDAYQQLQQGVLNGAVAVIKRYFLSDVANQGADVLLADTSNCAKSIIGQPPLDGSKIALWAYLMTGGTYLGKGKFLGFFGHFADPNNFYAYEWSFVVVDVKKKTVEKIPGIDPTIPWFAPSIHLDTDGTAFFGHADEKSGAIYRYDVESNKVTKEMDVKTGTAYFIVPLED